MGWQGFYNRKATDGMSEEERLALREEIKNALAQYELQIIRVGEMAEVIRATIAERDLAADDHSAVCAPLQSELAALDAEHIRAIREKKPLPAKLTQRRVEILAAVAAENAKLELRIEASKKAERKLTGEREKLRIDMPSRDLLAQSLVDLASAELREQHACTADRLEWARRRRAHAESLVRAEEGYIATERGHQYPDQRHLRLYESRKAAHELVASDACRQFNELDRELHELRQRAIEE